MKNKIIVSLLSLVIITYLFMSFFKGSNAISVDDTIKLELYDNYDREILTNDLMDFIDLIDENVFVNSSFDLSNVLNENYDFLTKFVISFVLDNDEYFDVIYGDNYIYVDEYGNRYNTDKYVNLDTLYEITNKIFGVEYYYVLDDNLIVNDMLLLPDINNYDFIMKIDKIENIDKYDNYYDVYVKYIDNEFRYIYRFNITLDNRLVLSNVIVEE